MAHALLSRDTLLALWRYLLDSHTLQLYLASIGTLMLAIGYEAWMRSVRLSFLDDVPLQVVERTQPHLPSPKVITCTFLCCVALLVVALQTITGLAPFGKPAEWIALGAFFIVAGGL